MKITDRNHLAYCTNIHPAESWPETFAALQEHVLAVRDRLRALGRLAPEAPYAIGLRLSARAAEELLTGDALPLFQDWLAAENCYVFTINGFPYGAFHGTRVKEKVFQPDWTTPERLAYTQQLFTIIAALCPADSGGSVSTLPGSHKTFEPDESAILENLTRCAHHIEELAQKTGKDLHLGLEPEPLGHFENTAESLAFFERLRAHAGDDELIQRRIGLNYDTCHFALEFDDCAHSLQALSAAGIRISKLHLSNALSFDPQAAESLSAIARFDEPTYFHQVILKNHEGALTRFPDLPDFLAAREAGRIDLSAQQEGRVHFHIPLYQSPLSPLASTLDHAAEAIACLRQSPQLCPHLEIETYTWGVLPESLQQDLTSQITSEYAWVLDRLASA
ncbi:MAG: metabolite traffic protein EboE [Verrucomicrobiales bacterium]